MKDFLKKNLKTIIFSFLITIIITTQNLIIKSNKELGFLSNINLLDFSIIAILSFFITFVVAKIIINFLLNLKITYKEYTNDAIKKLFICSFISMIAVWFICFIVNYPGGSMYDTYTQIDSAIYAATGHPIGHSLLLDSFIVILGYKILHRPILGWALFSIFQMCFMAGSISFAICFLAKRKISKRWLIPLIIFYTILPVYATYSIFAIKDVIFAIEILYLFLLLIKLVESNGKLLKNKLFLLEYVALNFAMYITRSNTIVVYIITTIALIYIYGKSIKPIIIAVFLIPIILNSGMMNTLKLIFHLEHRFQEDVAIPLQQISATVYADGKLNEKEKTYINNLMELEKIKENYQIDNIDSIKWNQDFKREYLQETKGEFLKTWATMLPKNFKTYVESYLLQVYYFWSFNLHPNATNMYNDVISIKITDSDEYVNGVRKYYKLYYPDILPESIQNPLEKFYNKYTTFLSEGSCFWIFIFLMLILIYKKQSKMLIANIPLLSVWLSLMLSSPVNSSMRYMFPFVLILPILFIYVITLEKNEEQNIKK